MIYLVAGPGRTGSTWLSDIIKDQLGVDQVLCPVSSEDPARLTHALTLPPDDPAHLTARLDDPIAVVHTHDKLFIEKYGISPENVFLIISRRRNTFEWILSNYIAMHTKEYGNYSNKEVEPFKMDFRRFQGKYLYRENWYNNFNFNLPYFNTATIYYEDMVNATSNKALLQDIISSPTEYPREYSYGKCPYNYKKWVSNWEELYVWYQAWESQRFI